MGFTIQNVKASCAIKANAFVVTVGLDAKQTEGKVIGVAVGRRDLTLNALPIR